MPAQPMPAQPCHFIYGPCDAEGEGLLEVLAFREASTAEPKARCASKVEIFGPEPR